MMIRYCTDCKWIARKTLARSITINVCERPNQHEVCNGRFWHTKKRGNLNDKVV